MPVEPQETAALVGDVEKPEAIARVRLLDEIAACRADPVKMLMHQRPITMAMVFVFGGGVAYARGGRSCWQFGCRSDVAPTGG